MGESYTVICMNCKKRYKVSIGGGFFFHLLHCDKCGKEKSISFLDIDKSIQNISDMGSLGESTYNKSIEEYAGMCKCSGKYSFEAPPRCPRCMSDKYERADESIILYD